MRNGGVAMQKIENACGVIDIACKIYDTACPMDKRRAALAAFKGDIYLKKNIFTYVKCPTPPLQNYINLRG
jgi:hypothetical protein